MTRWPSAQGWQRALALALALALAPAVWCGSAAAAPVADADSTVGTAVDAVATAGYWQADGRAGRYRVVVSLYGYEQVSSRVRVEWLAEPVEAGDSPAVLASADAELPQDGQSLALASVAAAGTGCARVQLSGVQSALPSRRVSYTLWATAPGQLSALSTRRSAATPVSGRPPSACRPPARR